MVPSHCLNQCWLIISGILSSLTWDQGFKIHKKFWKIYFTNVYSLAPGRPGCHFKAAIFNLVLLIGIFTSSNHNAHRRMPWDFTDDKSTLVQVKAWCLQATSHYLSQCWPSSMSPYGVTKPQWVKESLQHHMAHGVIWGWCTYIHQWTAHLLHCKTIIMTALQPYQSSLEASKPVQFKAFISGYKTDVILSVSVLNIHIWHFNINVLHGYWFSCKLWFKNYVYFEYFNPSLTILPPSITSLVSRRISSSARFYLMRWLVLMVCHRKCAPRKFGPLTLHLPLKARGMAGTGPYVITSMKKIYRWVSASKM